MSDAGKDVAGSGERRPITADSIVIRPLRAGDGERLFRKPERQALAAEWLARQERGEIYVAVAEVDGVPVGRSCLDFTYFPGERIGWLFASGVRAEWRSRGIGTMMYHHLEQVALAKGLLALRSVAVKDNPRAVHWHERRGDRCIGEGLARWTEPDGGEVEFDCWTFERRLGAGQEAEPG